MLEIPVPHNLCEVLESAVRSRLSSLLDSPRPNLKQKKNMLAEKSNRIK